MSREETPNRSRIAECIEEANISLANQTGLVWALSPDHRYQIANRFAWSWKLTELGYPVVLVYLGFLRAWEMRKGQRQSPFNSHTEWKRLLNSHSQLLFPQRFGTANGSSRSAIRSAHLFYRDTLTMGQLRKIEEAVLWWQFRIQGSYR